MNNMEIYELAKNVPDYAKKEITSGRMKGKTDISPMWRIERLTEIFGPCGIGWWYVIKDQRLEKGAGNEIKAFVDIDLYYKWGETVSQPIPGIGGNSYIAQENKGPYTNDECFKMALSDAISVAAKAIGIGADIYMGCDTSKYTGYPPEAPQNGSLPPLPPPNGQYSQRPQERRQQYAAPPQATPQQQAPPPQQQSGPPIEPVTGPDGYYYCADCGNIIQNQKLNDGRIMYPKDVAAMALRRHSAQLCAPCMKKREGVK